MKKLVTLMLILMTLTSCIRTIDANQMLIKKGYKVITFFEIQGVALVQKENKLGIYSWKNYEFRKSLYKEDYKEYIHWLPLTVEE